MKCSKNTHFSSDMRSRAKQVSFADTSMNHDQIRTQEDGALADLEALSRLAVCLRSQTPMKMISMRLHNLSHRQAPGDDYLPRRSCNRDHATVAITAGFRRKWNGMGRGGVTG